MGVLSRITVLANLYTISHAFHEDVQEELSLLQQELSLGVKKEAAGLEAKTAALQKTGDTFIDASPQERVMNVTYYGTAPVNESVPATRYPRTSIALMTCERGHVELKTREMNSAVYDDISAAIERLYDSLSTDCDKDSCQQADFAGCVLRYAGHDFMDFDPANNHGGSDGCVDFDDPDNAGLECISEGEHGVSLFNAYQEFCTEVSLADFVVISSEALMSFSRTKHGLNAIDFKGQFKFGRTTEMECQNIALPDAEESCAATERSFINRMGLDWKGSAALMGVHTLGRAQLQNSGYEGHWSDPHNSRIFNNNYYASVVIKGWMPKKRNWHLEPVRLQATQFFAGFTDSGYKGRAYKQLADSGWCTTGQIFDLKNQIDWKGFSLAECQEYCDLTPKCRSIILHVERKRCVGFSSYCSTRKQNANTVPYLAGTVRNYKEVAPSGWCDTGLLFHLRGDTHYTLQQCQEICDFTENCMSIGLHVKNEACLGFSSDCSSRWVNENIQPWTVAKDWKLVSPWSHGYSANCKNIGCSTKTDGGEQGLSECSAACEHQELAPIGEKCNVFNFCPTGAPCSERSTGPGRCCLRSCVSPNYPEGNYDFTTEYGGWDVYTKDFTFAIKTQWARSDGVLFLDTGPTDPPNLAGEEMMLNTDMCLMYGNGFRMPVNAATDECCAWVPHSRYPKARDEAWNLTSGTTKGMLRKIKDKHGACGTEFFPAGGTNLFHRQCCATQTFRNCGNCNIGGGVGDGTEIVYNFGHCEELPHAMNGPAEMEMIMFAYNETYWLEEFLAAWQKATENGFTTLKRLSP